MRGVVWVALSALLSLPVDVLTAQSLEKPWPCVARLQIEQQQSIEIDGIKYRVILNREGTTELKPYIIPTDVATAFFVAEGNSLFLVTAGHVARKTSPEWQLTVGTAEDRPISFQVRQLVASDKEFHWVYHDTADVAVLLLSPSSSVKPHLAGRFLKGEMLRSDLVAPERERPLTTIGFPLGLGIGDYFSPISRESKPASGIVSLESSDTKRRTEFFLLDSPSIGGFSGAPVFEMPGAYSSQGGLVIGGKLICVGIIHGTLSDNTGGKLGMVTPAVRILETIKKALNPKPDSNPN